MTQQPKRNRWHELKVDPEPFQAMWDNAKRADLRDLSDRDIQEGDTVRFEEFDRTTQTYSGRVLRTKITHIQRGYILPRPGDCITYDCRTPEARQEYGIDGAMLSFQITRKYTGIKRCIATV